MGRTPAYHHVGTVLLLISMVMMLIVCLSAPLVNDLNFLSATIADTVSEKTLANTKIQAGVFGYCLAGQCMAPRIGYNQTMLSANGDLKLDDVFISSLTYGLVMNPLATAFVFFAFLFAFGGQSTWSPVAAFFSLWSLILNVVALGIDAGVFGIAADRLNRETAIVPRSVTFGSAFYLVIIAVVCQFIATLVICCSRRSIRRQKAKEQVTIPLTRQDTIASYASDSPLNKGEKNSSKSHFRRRSGGNH